MIKFILISLLFMKINGQDWCNIPYCPSGSHIACNHSGQFAASCSSPSTVTFTTDQINQILHKHNELRDKVARGQAIGFQNAQLPSATRMARIRWSDELALTARLNTKQCLMRHDSCRNTHDFNFSGQNLAIRYDFSINVTSSIDTLINVWINEQAYVRVSDILSLSSTTGGNNQVIGHWTTMLNEKMTHIGCAMSTFNSVQNGSTWRTALLACNYAFTNFIGRRVYQNGNTAADCVTGRDGTYNSLCTLNEPIDVNDYWS